MKAIWNTLAVFAIANILGVAGFVGWLVSSDRLNKDRAREIRVKLSETLTAEKARLDADKAKAEDAARTSEKAKKEDRPPLTAEEQLAARVEATELDKQRAERLRKEVQNLQATLATERAKLDADRAAFEAEKVAFQKATGAKMTQAAKEQFDKTLAIVSSLKPAQAKGALLQMMGASAAPAAQQQPGAQAAADSGAVVTPPSSPGQAAPPVVSEHGLAQVVEYLNAMDDRPRNKIMAEFMKDDPRLAADLLARLRDRGTLATAPEPPKR